MKGQSRMLNSRQARLAEWRAESPIRKAREAARMGSVAVATLAGISQPTLSKIELGSTKSSRHVEAVAEVLGKGRRLVADHAAWLERAPIAKRREAAE